MILYMRTQRSTGEKLAFAGAALAAAAGAWWLASETIAPPVAAFTPPAEPTMAIAATAPVVAPRVAEPSVAAVPAAPPVQYLGQWLEGRQRAVLLGVQGRSVIVKVPGRVDDRYEVVSADERELVLKDVAGTATQRVALGGSPVGVMSAGVATSGTAGAAPTRQSVVVTPTAVMDLPKLPPPSQRTTDADEPEN